MASFSWGLLGSNSAHSHAHLLDTNEQSLCPSSARRATSAQHAEHSTVERRSFNLCPPDAAAKRENRLEPLPSEHRVMRIRWGTHRGASETGSLKLRVARCESPPAGARRLVSARPES
jgi:hypothetical protein